MLVRQYPLAFDQQSADLGLSDDIPPVFTVLDYILNHLVVITFELVVLLIVEQSQRFNAIVNCKDPKILVYLLKYFLDLQNLFDVDLDILGPSWLVFFLFTVTFLSGITVPY